MSGASIQMYAVGTTGDGSAATPLFATPLTTDASGEFDYAGAYTCPTADALVYMVATGGDPGTGTINPQISMMVALGACGSLTPTTNVTINEVTTVAAVWSLAPYMQSATSIGASSNDAAALTASFKMANELANPATGTTPGANAPDDATLPIAQINTLADILASCIDSNGGSAGDGSSCGTLFQATTPSGGVAPNDVLSAALLLANNPSQNAGQLFGLIQSSAPFQPVVTTAPASFTLPTTFPSGLAVSPAAVSFPDTYVTSSSTAVLTLTNNGTAAVQISEPILAGSNVTEFSVAMNTQSSPCSTTTPLAAGATCTMSVTFSPASMGQKSADLQIVSDAPNPLIHVALSGQGQVSTPGALSFTLTPGSLTFEEIGIPQTVTVTNTGSEAFNLVITPNYFYPVSGNSTGLGESDNCTQAPIAPAASCTITVQIYTIGMYSIAAPGSLTVEAHAGSDVVTQALGIAQKMPQGVQLDGRPLDFGAWPIGGYTSLPQTVTLSSPPNVEILGTLSGANTQDFHTDCTSVVGQCKVTFTPTALGARTATLQTQYGDIALSGTGQQAGPAISIMPTTSYYNVPVGGNGAVGFLIINNGTEPETPALSLIPPTNTSVFSINPQYLCTGTLQPGETCQTYVNFIPTQMGVQSASLQVITDKGASAVKNYTQTALPQNSGLQFSSNPLEMGVTELNNSSSTYVYLNVQDNFSASAPTGGNANGDFSATFQGCGVSTGNSCMIAVTFTPSALGLRTTSFVITDETTHQTGTLWVKGTGGQIILNASPESLSFPSTEVGTTSAVQVITVKNNGSVANYIRSSILEANAGSFVLSANSCNGITSYFSPGQSCTVSVAFRPIAQGTASATLQLVEGKTTLSVPLSGTATPSTSPSGFTVSSSSLSFSEVVGFSSDPQGLTITNSGTNAQNITVQILDENGIPLPFVGDFIIENNQRCLAMQGGASCRIDVYFSPQQAGLRQRALQVVSQPSGRTMTIPLTGTGVAPSGGPLVFSPAGGLFFGEIGVPQSVTLTNSGSSAVTIRSINYEAGNCPDVLQGQASCTISVDGSQGNLEVYANSSSTPYTLPISVPAPPLDGSSFQYGPVAFGPVAVGSTGSSTVVSYGGSYYSAPIPFQISGISGTNASEFSYAESCWSPPGGSCPVQLTFTPQGTGLRTAMLETEFGVVPMYGIGGNSNNGADFTLTQSDFPSSIVPGYVGLVTVTNTGTALLLIQRPVPPSGTGYYGMRLLPSLGCVSTPIWGPGVGNAYALGGYSIPVGGSCKLQISFDVDQSTGAKSEALTLTDAISGVSKSIALNGNAGAGVSAPTVSQSLINVGNLPIGTSTAVQTVTVSAPNGDPVTSSVSTSNGETYVFDPGSCASQTPCQMSLKVTPTAPGSFFTDVHVTDPVTGKSAEWSITGTGGLPVPAFSPESINFGTQPLYQPSAAQSFRITNTGEVDLTVSSFTMSSTSATPADFTVNGGTCIGTSIPVGGICTATVSFRPNGTGARSATLGVVSNGGTTFGIQLSGIGQ